MAEGEVHNQYMVYLSLQECIAYEWWLAFFDKPVVSLDVPLPTQHLSIAQPQHFPDSISILAALLSRTPYTKIEVRPSFPYAY